MIRATLRFSAYALPFRRPFQTARERLEVRRGYLVCVRDEDGREGFGEAAPIAGFGMETLAETRMALERWADHAQGLRLLGEEGATFPLISTLPDAHRAPAACHGLESALADLKARRRGVPLHAWLLGAAGAADRVREIPAAVPVNGTLGAVDPDEAGSRAAALAAAGFETLKVKVGDGERDAARVRAAHRAAPAARLRVDANGGWDEEQALAWLHAQGDLPLEYAEQPVPAGDLAALARVAAASPIPIAADESALGEPDIRAVLDARAAQVLVLKPMALGGPLATLRVARFALSAGAQVVITTSLEGAFGRTTALHVAAAVQALAGRALPACGLATGDLLQEDLVANAPTPSGGRLSVPSEIGLGLTPKRPSPI